MIIVNLAGRLGIFLSDWIGHFDSVWSEVF